MGDEGERFSYIIQTLQFKSVKFKTSVRHSCENIE